MTDVRELSSPPNLAVLYAKAVPPSLPLVGSLPVVGRRAKEVPDVELVLPDVRIDRDHLAAFDRVCGFTLSDELPATYPHMLAFPLSMDLMTRLSFPFGVIGLVHVANRIELLRPMSAGEPFDLTVGTADLRDHERGRQFDVVAEATVDGEPAWRSRSTYLHREGGSGAKKERRESEPQPPAEGRAVWKVPGDIGRRYAAVSGDANPIHLHPLTARLFGFKGAIAHGMWVKARSLAALEGHLPETYTAEARFKLPMTIPAKAAFASWPQDGGRAFSVTDARSGKPYLSGTVTA
jgi:acyl dehydratase